MKIRTVAQEFSRDLAVLTTEGTARAWRHYIDSLAESKYGDETFESITASDFKTYYKVIRRTSVKRANGRDGFGAVSNAQSAFRSLWAFALDEGYTKRASVVPAVETESNEVIRRAYTDLELSQIMSSLMTSRDPALGNLAMRLALETGARRAGLLSINMGAMRSSSGLIAITPKRSTGKAHFVPVTADLWAAIQLFVSSRTKRHSKDTPILLNLRGEPITRRWFENAAHRVRLDVPSLAEEGSSWFTWHGLRHTSAVRIRQIAGVEVATAFLGHSVKAKSVTERYTKAGVDEVRQALSTLWDAPMAGENHPYTRANFKTYEERRELDLERLRDELDAMPSYRID